MKSPSSPLNQDCTSKSLTPADSAHCVRCTLLPSYFIVHTEGSEIRVPSAENPGVLLTVPGTIVGQDMALHASSTAGNSVFLFSAFPAHSTSSLLILPGNVLKILFRDISLASIFDFLKKLCLADCN